MALSAAQKQRNRKDRAAGKTPRHQSAAVTGAASQTIDGTYGAEEQTTIATDELRIGEAVVALQDADILA